MRDTIAIVAESLLTEAERAEVRAGRAALAAALANIEACRAESARIFAESSARGWPVLNGVDLTLPVNLPRSGWRT